MIAYDAGYHCSAWRHATKAELILTETDVHNGNISFVSQAANAWRLSEHSSAFTHTLASCARGSSTVAPAAELLDRDCRVASDVWSATSFSELAREAREVERYNRLHPEALSCTSHLAN